MIESKQFVSNFEFLYKSAKQMPLFLNSNQRIYSFDQIWALVKIKWFKSINAGKTQLHWFSYYWHRFNEQFFTQLISNVNRLTAHAEKNLIKDLKLDLHEAQ